MMRSSTVHRKTSCGQRPSPAPRVRPAEKAREPLRHTLCSMAGKPGFSPPGEFIIPPSSIATDNLQGGNWYASQRLFRRPSPELWHPRGSAWGMESCSGQPNRRPYNSLFGSFSGSFPQFFSYTPHWRASLLGCIQGKQSWCLQGKVSIEAASDAFTQLFILGNSRVLLLVRSKMAWSIRLEAALHKLTGYLFSCTWRSESSVAKCHSVTCRTFFSMQLMMRQGWSLCHNGVLSWDGGWKAVWMRLHRVRQKVIVFINKRWEDRLPIFGK
jgi:hypothetical protein